MRQFANVALKEKEKALNSQCFREKLKTKTVPELASIDVKPYDEIPGPRGIFGIGTFYQYFPVFGM